MTKKGRKFSKYLVYYFDNLPFENTSKYYSSSSIHRRVVLDKLMGNFESCKRRLNAVKRRLDSLMTAQS